MAWTSLLSFQSAGERLNRIKEAKAEIERRAAERYAEEQKAYEDKMAERAKKEQKTGKKPRGKVTTAANGRANGKGPG